MKTALLICAVVSVISQFYHTDYVMQLGSYLGKKILWGKNKGKQDVRGLNQTRIQSYLFSIIISAAIIFTVLLKMHWVALFWTFIEMAVGFIYQKHNINLRTENKRYRTPDKWERTAGYFIAILIPFCIYAFSFMYAEYDLIMEIFNHSK